MSRWAVAGLIAPMLYLAMSLATGSTPGEGIFVFWPGAMGLMVLNDGPPWITTVIVWAVVIISNVLLYSITGLLLCLIARASSAKSQSDQDAI